MWLDIAIICVCYRLLLFFVVSTLKECKIFDFSGFFSAILLAVAFKRRKRDYG